MIKINIEEILTIEKWFFDQVKNRSRSGIRKDNDAQILYNFFNENISRIVRCKPIDLCNIITEFEERFGKKPKGLEYFKNYMKGQYDIFIRENGYELAERLNVKVCPYCNRQYTFTAKRLGESKGVRPQFDHFYSKSDYPYLALSFYNLIPSCPTCNHLKGIETISINPYVKGFDASCKFAIDKLEWCILNGDIELWNIELPHDGDHIRHVNAFVLSDLYNQHKDYVEDIVFKAKSYNEGYYKSLMRSFSELGLSENEMSLFIFGNYISMDDYDKRPLSKLTADILEQLEIKL